MASIVSAAATARALSASSVRMLMCTKMLQREGRVGVGVGAHEVYILKSKCPGVVTIQSQDREDI